jgi:diguanylate cyclase (GGDEF)-like protein/PAS domain S-box-containing protein
VSKPEAPTLFDLLPIGAYRSSPEGVLLHVNLAFVRMHGFASQAELHAQLGNTPCNPYVVKDRKERFAKLMTRRGQVTDFVSEMYRLKTRERIWVREHAHPVRDKKGRLLYFEGTLEDITQEIRAKSTVRQSEAMLRNVLQTIPDHVWLKDIEGVYLTCNATFAASIGVAPQQIAGTRDTDWFTDTVSSHFRATDRLAIQAGRTVSFEENFPSKINTLGEMHEVVKTPMRDDNGNIIGVLGMARNIQQRKVAESLLRDTTEQLELALMGADLGRWDHDLSLEQGYFLDQHACSMLGRNPLETTTPRSWSDLVHTDDVPTVLTAMRAHLSGLTDSYQAEYRARHANGSWLWVSSRGKVVQFSQDGLPRRMVGTLMDISARKLAEEHLRATQAELQATLNALPDSLFEFNSAGRYRAVHSHDVALLTQPAGFLLDKAVQDVLPPTAANACLQALAEAHTKGRSHGIQYCLELPGGNLWFELSVVRKPTLPAEEERFIAIARDITERKNAEEAIRHMAFHDTLTGLPNRRMLTDRLQIALLASARNRDHGALMFLDLDQFKQLNDTQGHDTGDLMLQEVARRLLQSTRAIDTVARLGGDEFVVLIQDLSADVGEARLHATTVGHKILSSLNEPFVLAGHRHTTTPSIGVTLFSGDLLPPNDILKQADLAMYVAKSRGRNTLCFYESEEVVSVVNHG